MNDILSQNGKIAIKKIKYLIDDIHNLGKNKTTFLCIDWSFIEGASLLD